MRARARAVASGRREGAPVVSGVTPSTAPPAAIAREFKELVAHGAQLVVGGTARADPQALLGRGYLPRHKIELFDTLFYLGAVRQNPSLRFFVAWVLPRARARRQLYARIFYKDLSLVWRCASHYVPTENWVGKGDVEIATRGGWEYVNSLEETTDLPLEIQDALETVSSSATRVPVDHQALGRVLRNAPPDRIAPYADFSAPRRRAARDPARLVHGGRRVAWFKRRHDPASLCFARGFEPDFSGGIVSRSHSHSRMYGGAIERVRILSTNRTIQYLFMAAPRHVWIIPAQTLERELTSFGVRTISVAVDEMLCVPGYEYHYLDDSESPPVFVSQIPPGYAGAPSAVDPSRADASAWLDELPVIQAFRREVLGKRR